MNTTIGQQLRQAADVAAGLDPAACTCSPEMPSNTHAQGCPNCRVKLSRTSWYRRPSSASYDTCMGRYRDC